MFYFQIWKVVLNYFVDNFFDLPLTPNFYSETFEVWGDYVMEIALILCFPRAA